MGDDQHQRCSEQGLRSTDITLLKRARRKERVTAEKKGPGDMAHHHEALPSHEPVISRWSGASCLAFQPSTNLQHYLVGDIQHHALWFPTDHKKMWNACTEPFELRLLRIGHTLTQMLR